MFRHEPELLGKLTAYDFISKTVTIKFEHNEGMCVFRNSFPQREGDKGKYTVVYTEHLGYHVFLTDTIVDLKWEY